MISSTLWAEVDTQRTPPHIQAATLPSIPGRWCFTYGSWKENDIFSRQGWFNGMYEELTTVSDYVCNGLFSIDEDGFGTRRMASLCKVFRRYQDFERKFFQIKDHLCTKDVKLKGG